jgi:hypothetical protein
MLLRCLIRSRETMHLGKTHRFKKIASDAWHVGAGSAIIDGVCCGCAPCKGGAFQWVQAPPGNRSSRKQSEQSWR